MKYLNAPVNLTESLRRVFIPTTAESYRKRDRKYRADSEPIIEILKNKLETVETMIIVNQEERSTMLSNLRTTLQVPTAISANFLSQTPILSRSSSFSSNLQDESLEESLGDDNPVSGLCRNIKERCLLQSYEIELKESIQKYQYLVNTQATADDTGFRELRDWAKETLNVLEFLTTVLISISTVGAGLVYATIFSASRGNIGFMCLTFPLFTVGFFVPVTAQILLKSATKLPYPVPFASQKFWRYIINIFMAFAVISVLTALVVLNVTVFFLDPNTPSTSNISLLSIPGIAIFAFSGSIFLILFGAIGLAIFARGRASVISPLNATSSLGKSNVLANFKHV